MLFGTRTTALLLAVFTLAPIPAAAESFPARPVRLVVPFAAGTAPDLIARLLAEHLQPRWQQSVIVENRPGASGNVGAEMVVRSPPDGHTLLVSPPPPLAINRFLFATLPYRPSDLTTVTVAASAPNVLVARSGLAATDLAGLIALARMPPPLRYASTGRGGTPHLVMAWLASAASLEMSHIPYPKGLAPALNDLLGGHVDLMFANLADARPLVEAGKLKALAVTSAEPVADLPGIAPATRTVPGLVAETWYAVAAPGETPEAIVRRIAADIASVLAAPEVGGRLRALSLTPVGSMPADASAFVAAEAERWRGVITTVGLKPE